MIYYLRQCKIFMKNSRVIFVEIVNSDGNNLILLSDFKVFTKPFGTYLYRRWRLAPIPRFTPSSSRHVPSGEASISQIHLQRPFWHLVNLNIEDKPLHRLAQLSTAFSSENFSCIQFSPSKWDFTGQLLPLLSSHLLCLATSCQSKIMN